MGSGKNKKNSQITVAGPTRWELCRPVLRGMGYMRKKNSMPVRMVITDYLAFEKAVRNTGDFGCVPGILVDGPWSTSVTPGK